MNPLLIRLPRHDLREALRMTAYPGQVKAAHPRLRVRVEGDRLGRALFAANPHVDEVVWPRPWSEATRFPEGSDHWIPELHVAAHEREAMERFIEERTLEENRAKPLCVLHPWPNSPGGGVPGQPHPGLDYWDEAVRQASHRFRFWQLGGPDDACVQGCEYYFFTRWQDGWGTRELRRAIALVDRAHAFAGIDRDGASIALGLGKPRALVSAAGVGGDPRVAAKELAATLAGLSLGPQ